MCKNWLLFLLTLCLTTISVEKLAGQSPNHLRYFTDVDRMYEAKESQALYVESQLVLADSSIAIEVTRIKDQQIVRYELYQDGFPFGAWQYFDEDLNKNLFVHYPYEVAYTDELYDNEIYFDFRRALNGEKEFDGFEAPGLKTSNSFYHCVGSQIVYPEFSRRNGHEELSGFKSKSTVKANRNSFL